VNEQEWDLLLDSLPPSDNTRQRWTTNAEVEFRAIVAAAVKARSLRPVKGFHYLDVGIVWPDKRKRDPGNLFKTLCDALQRGGAVEGRAASGRQ